MAKKCSLAAIIEFALLVQQHPQSCLRQRRMILDSMSVCSLVVEVKSEPAVHFLLQVSKRKKHSQIQKLWDLDKHPHTHMHTLLKFPSLSIFYLFLFFHILLSLITVIYFSLKLVRIQNLLPSLKNCMTLKLKMETRWSWWQKSKVSS